MSRTPTLRQSLISSHIMVSLIPLGCISLFILLFIVQSVREDFMVRIDLLAKGIRGQIQLFMDQPLTSLNTIGSMLADTRQNDEEITRILNTHIRESLYFESIYLLDSTGTVKQAGLPTEREQYRQDLLGINLGHKEEFKTVLQTGQPEWSDTFLSLSSGKVSLTLYVPAGDKVLAADINLNTLAQFITRLSSDKVVTMVVDRNGAIMFHPDPNLVGKSLMMNDIPLIQAALAGEENIGQFTFQGETYVGSTSSIQPIGWVSLIAEPTDRFATYLTIPLLIIGSGICAAVGFSLLLAFFRARKLSSPLTEITAKSSVIAQGDYAHPLPPSNYAELQQLTDSINHMAGAIQKREEELRDKEQKYRELVENTNNLVLRLNNCFTITYVNYTIRRLTGISAHEALGMKLQDCIAAEDWPQLESSLNSWVARRVGSETAECRIHNRDGVTSHLLLTFNMHYDVWGALLDLSIIGHDITVRYQIEQQKREMDEQRQQSQKMELLGLMAGGVAHDLNNILAGIINYPELMLLKLDQESPLRGPLQSIKKSGERAAAVVADLLTVARDSAAVYETTELNQLISGYLTTPEFHKLRSHHPEIEFEFVPCLEPWPVNCSPIHIEKVLMNLVINAFEAIKTSGKVEVRTDNIEPEQLPEDTAPLLPVPHVAFMVRDSGEGIAPADLKKIFEPFFSKKGLGRSGTGLGLAVAWNTVCEHGGTIHVNSGPAGTLFTVLLPAARTLDIPRKQLEATAHLRGHGEHILCVDDEEVLRDITVTMLDHLGYKASAVESGEEALSVLRETPVDLVLLDMQMDPGMSGKETYSRIKAEHPRQKALIATGYSTSSDVEATLQAGAGSFIKKPYSLFELGQAVHDILHRS